MTITVMVLQVEPEGNEIGVTYASFWGCTLPETNSSHLNLDGWNAIVSFWDGLFSGAMLVLGRVGLEKARTNGKVLRIQLALPWVKLCSWPLSFQEFG